MAQPGRIWKMKGLLELYRPAVAGYVLLEAIFYPTQTHSEASLSERPRKLLHVVRV
jgi:hypothetical protein